MRALSSVVLVMTLCMAARAHEAEDARAPAGLSDAEVRHQVHAYLSTIDTPVPAASWLALGSGAELVLREVIAEGDNFPTRRAGAIDALAIVAGKSAAIGFQHAAQAESEPLVVRLAAPPGGGHTSD